MMMPRSDFFYDFPRGVYRRKDFHGSERERELYIGYKGSAGEYSSRDFQQILSWQ